MTNQTQQHPVVDHRVARDDVGVMAAGVAVFIFSLLPWVGLFGFTANAWSMGLTAWPPVLISIIVAGALAAEALGGRKLPVGGPIGPRLALALGSAVVAVWLMIRAITLLAQSGPFSGSTEAGLWLAVVAALAQAGFAYRALRASGEAVPLLKP